MIKTISILAALLVCHCASAEMRVWEFKGGKSLEAEFAGFSRGEVSLKTAKGKIRKVPAENLADNDLLYIELMNVPKLDLSFGKTSSQRIYPPTYNQSEFPRQSHYHFAAKVKQTSSKVYRHPLTIELFIVGEENYGSKKVLYGYTKEEFFLPEGTKSSFELKTDKITMTEYTLNGVLRGEAFRGYVIIVTDSLGNVVASKATKDDWLAIADNLRKLPVGRTFDENGERTTPSRPPRFY